MEYSLQLFLLISFPLYFIYMAHPLRFIAIESCKGAIHTLTLTPDIDYLEQDRMFKVLELCLHRLLDIVIYEGYEIALTYSLVFGHLKLHHVVLSEL